MMSWWWNDPPRADAISPLVIEPSPLASSLLNRLSALVLSTPAPLKAFSNSLLLIEPSPFASSLANSPAPPLVPVAFCPCSEISAASVLLSNGVLDPLPAGCDCG